MTAYRDTPLAHRSLSPEQRRELRAALLRQVTSQRGRRHWRWSFTASAAGIAATVVVMAMLLLVGPFGVTHSGAAWAAVPEQAPSAELSHMRAQCLQLLTKVPTAAAPAPSPPWLATIAERRGSTTSVLVASHRSIGLCIGLEKPREDGLTAPGPFPVGLALTIDGTPGQLSSNGSRVVFGRVRGKGTVVKVDTADGRRVVASADSGYYLAWWPSGADPTSVTAYGPGQRVLAVLHPTPTRLIPAPPGSSESDVSR